MKGLALTLFPVREIGASLENPVCPLVVRILIEVVWTPGETTEALALPAFRTYPVKLNTTGKVKEAPASRLPVGRLEFVAWNMLLPRISPPSEVIGILATHVTFSVAELPIRTDPKSSELQVSGRATGDP
jgi:hypothetical protein